MAEHAHGPVVGLVDDLPELSCHTGFDGRAFGQAAADDAVAVLVAAPPTGTVGAGDVIPARPRPVFRRFGRYGRQDSLSLDGNHVLRLISLLMPDGLRHGKRAIFLTPVPLPTSIWMTWRSSSDRCEYTFPIGATSLRTGYLDNLQSNGCCTFN